MAGSPESQIAVYPKVNIRSLDQTVPYHGSLGSAYLEHLKQKGSLFYEIAAVAEVKDPLAGNITKSDSLIWTAAIVATHEIGHEINVKRERDILIGSASVIPDSGSLGRVVSMSNPNKSLLSALYSRLRICLGGQAAAEKVGSRNPKFGTGGDYTQAQGTARIISHFTGESVSRLLSDGLQGARSNLAHVSKSWLLQRSMYITRKQYAA